MSQKCFSVIEITCDECGRLESMRFYDDSLGFHPDWTVRASLARVGWTSRGSHDWCPECSKGRKEAGT